MKKFLPKNAVTIISVLFLVIFFVSVYIDIHRIEHRNHSRLYVFLKTHLDSKQGIEFPPPEGYENIALYKKNIYIFGASSLVMSNGRTFPEYLNEMFNSGSRDTLVTNWGLPGIDSFSVKKRVIQALATMKKNPDLIIIYSGHNEYTNVYQGSMPLYKELPGARLMLAINYNLQGAKYKDKYCPGDKKCNYENYARALSPRIINAYQASRLATLDGAKYKRYNDLIIEHFMKNAREIIAEARNRDIPIVFCTVIGNLHAEPFGDYRTVTKTYRNGISAGKYEDRIRLLSAARDGEIFSFDLRAKSELNDCIRSLADESVFVIDIENLMIQNQFDFGNDDFMDYLHMKTSTHKTIASLLAHFIEQHNLLKEYPTRQ